MATSMASRLVIDLSLCRGFMKDTLPAAVAREM
jgi:hypothetical protein